MLASSGGPQPAADLGHRADARVEQILEEGQDDAQDQAEDEADRGVAGGLVAGSGWRTGRPWGPSWTPEFWSCTFFFWIDCAYAFCSPRYMLELRRRDRRRGAAVVGVLVRRDVRADAVELGLQVDDRLLDRLLIEVVQ